MKKIEYTRHFKKRYKQRVGNNPKLIKQLEERVEQFLHGVRDEPLNDHPLKGKMKPHRAFSIAGDIRVVYREEPDAYYFVDIGKHNQVYK